MSFGRTVTAAEIAEPFVSQIRDGTAAITSALGRSPRLVGFLASTDAPSRAYARFTAKACANVGIEFELRELGSTSDGKVTIAMSEVEDAILAANEDEAVDGIMTYFPLFRAAGQVR